MAHVPVKKRKISHEHDIHKFQGKESIITSQIEIYVEEAQPKIPDGGWGWMIVLSAFALNAISEGVSFSFGLLYMQFLTEFKSTKSATSWVGSLFLAVPLLAGPVGSAMVDRYGCLKMTVLGSLVCTTGFVLSMFVNSLSALYITFGIIGGIGRALTFVTAVVSIAFWFEKKRAVALGLAASGTGVGTIVFAPLTTLFINEYGWRGTMLMLAGCFLNMSVCGVMMRDPEWIVQEERVKKEAKKIEKKKKKALKERKKLKNDEFLLQRVNTSLDLTEKNRIRSVIDLPTFVRENEKLPVEVINKLSENKQVYKIILENYPSLLKTKSTSTQEIHNIENHNNASRVPVRFSLAVQKTENTIVEEDEEDNDEDFNNYSPLLDAITEANEEEEPHSYLQSILLKRNNTISNGIGNVGNSIKVTMSSPDVYSVYRSTVTNAPTKKVKKKWYVQFYKSVTSMLDFSLFLELHFFLLALSTTILFIWFIVPYFYIAEYMTKLGYTESQASFVLSAIGLTNTIGMVFLGWAGERMNIAKTYGICIILCGISIACIIWFSSSFVMLVITCACFGLFFASCFSLLPSLLGELVPLEDFTMAYGLILLCMGVGNLAGPPLAGFLYDLTDSWVLSFYQAAGWIILSGVLIGLISLTENRKLGGSPLNKA